jgi:hypothetical protein
MPRKTDFQSGLETILNNPQTSFLRNPATFNEIQKQSTMSVGAMIRHVGKTAKNTKGKPKEPTEEEKVKARLDAMEKRSETK